MTFFGLECPICYEKLSGSKRVTSTYCGHTFHDDCLSSWMLKKNTCPMCIKRLRNSLHSPPRLVEVKLPNPSEIQKSLSSVMDIDDSTGLSKKTWNELLSSASQSRNPITPHQLQEAHKNLNKDYQKLQVAHEAGVAEGDILQGIAQSLRDEKERLKKEMEGNKLSMAQKRNASGDSVKKADSQTEPDPDQSQPKKQLPSFK